MHVTRVSQGESLTQYEVKPNDVLIADRGLAHRRGIRHVLAHQGEGMVRTHLPLCDEHPQAFSLLPQLRTLAVGQAGEWHAWLYDAQGAIPVRVCAYKKRTTQAQHKLRQAAKRKQRSAPRPETLETAGDVILLTTGQAPAAETILA